ncbi:hypothetical protein P3X46_025062 [Hevea brasiliensis]|uniref:BHLH domain-containing protein n=1 Tax=Hevea brasiliensis TaxID=3981 RepID=A0ABQ9L4D7_HEVBR|nr:transcription factor bHLH95-like [Hevea brasiliensis]KAJ9159559.1 hypothetical protein P3X46_025062 [Hevea brasiliensis]
MALSKEEAHHHEAFLWENQKWVLSNSDNTSGGSHEKSEKKVLPSSNTLNGQTQLGKELAKSKRGRGDVHKNGKGSDDSGAKHEKASGGGGGGCGGGGESDHEIHIWTERERRKKMRNMFANLHTLLPQLPPKADKSTIVDEAVNYIKTLQQTLQKLQKQKLERLQGATAFSYDPTFSLICPQKLADSREAFLADQGSNNLAIASTKPSNNVPSVARFPVLFQTWTSSNVVLNICGDEAQISICSSKKHCLFTTICYVLEKHNIEILSAHVSSDCNQSMYMIQAHVNRTSDHFSEAMPVEEIYRQAAGEIMCWVSS